MSAGKYNVKLLDPSFTPWAPKQSAQKQIVVLMSGGVDSTVSACLLKEQGWDVLGITMKIPVSCNTGRRSCCGADAAFVCKELDIPHYFVAIDEPFNELVIKPFRRSYTTGETPNPCVDCNTSLKFSLLWDFLQHTFGITRLATGHYARVSRSPRGTFLGRAKDKTKDQSYFLYGIAVERLAKLILPLGELTKNKVRSIAANAGLSIAEKAESMELCFAGEGDYRGALTDIQTGRDGDITDIYGNRIGKHDGVANYTLGQRKGIGFAGGRPLYVSKIDARSNTIVLAIREQVTFTSVSAGEPNILIPQSLVEGRQLLGKIRSYGDPARCRLTEATERRITVRFDQPQFAPCPGQRLVLYDYNDNVVAGGTILSDGKKQPNI